jgi:hypothetical protein
MDSACRLMWLLATPGWTASDAEHSRWSVNCGRTGPSRGPHGAATVVTLMVNGTDAYGDAMVVADMYSWHIVAVEQENIFSLARFQP